MKDRGCSYQLRNHRKTSQRRIYFPASHETAQLDGTVLVPIELRRTAEFSYFTIDKTSLLFYNVAVMNNEDNTLLQRAYLPHDCGTTPLGDDLHFHSKSLPSCHWVKRLALLLETNVSATGERMTWSLSVYIGLGISCSPLVLLLLLPWLYSFSLW